MTVMVELKLPRDWRKFRMPPALHDRLHELLDKQDREGKLSARERREASALTELVDMLSLMKLQAQLAKKRKRTMSLHVSAALARLVRRRPRDRCEYCLLPQSGQEASFHIDHVRPGSEGGVSEADNLALACVTCSLKKGARRLAVDPQTGALTTLFNPRQDRWTEHFRWMAGMRLAGRTVVGRATIKALGMNRPPILMIRRALAHMGRFPFSPQ